MAEYTGFNIKSSYTLQLNSLPDSVIYKLARDKGNVILISKDADFNELISRLGSLPKLITIKKKGIAIIGKCGTLSNLILSG